MGDDRYLLSDLTAQNPSDMFAIHSLLSGLFVVLRVALTELSSTECIAMVQILQNHSSIHIWVTNRYRARCHVGKAVSIVLMYTGYDIALALTGVGEIGGSPKQTMSPKLQAPQSSTLPPIQQQQSNSTSPKRNGNA